MMRRFVVVMLLVGVAQHVAAQAPSTDIFLAPLKRVRDSILPLPETDPLLAIPATTTDVS